VVEPPVRGDGGGHARVPVQAGIRAGASDPLELQAGRGRGAAEGFSGIAVVCGGSVLVRPPARIGQLFAHMASPCAAFVLRRFHRHSPGGKPVRYFVGGYSRWRPHEDVPAGRADNPQRFCRCSGQHAIGNCASRNHQVEKVLGVIQKFDPPGIAARNLQECLLIQLREKKDADELAIRMVSEYFEDFTNKRFEKISKKLEIPLNEVKRIMDFVAKLNPKPGYRYISESESYIIPDVIVKKEDGKFTISLNDYNIPRLRINNTYKNLLPTYKLLLLLHHQCILVLVRIKQQLVPQLTLANTDLV